MTKSKANRDSEKTTKPSAALDDEIADLLRQRPSEQWWLHKLITFAAVLIQAARDAAVVKNRLSALPAAPLRQAGQALLIADRRLLGTGMLLTLVERYGVESKLAFAAMRLARQVPAKAVAGGLTVGEVQQRRGIRKSTDNYDRLDDDRPEIANRGIDSAAPASHEIREQAGHVEWALEGLDLMIARHGLPTDSVEDSLLSLDRIHAAALRIVRNIEVQGLLHPALAYITGRGPRRRATRRARKAVAPWEVEDNPSDTQGPRT